MDDKTAPPLMKDPLFQRILLIGSLALAATVGAVIYWGGSKPDPQPVDNADDEEQVVARKWKLEQIPFDGNAAYQWVKDLCAIGPRVSGTPGMAKQQKLLADHFKSLGGKVTFQKFDVRHPQTGERTTLANLIVEWHPERKDRILLAAHYDTRPFPDRDPVDPRGVFLGANDGASGAAVLCELGRQMPKLESKYGVDFILFDGEELIYSLQEDERNVYFLGSKYFANEYRTNPPPYRYKMGALLDMVGDASLQLHYERNSYSWPETRPVMQSIWGTAKRLGVDEFIPTLRHEVRDDHLAIRNVAGIPMCDIIDFDYPYPNAPRQYWHTTEDKPENCSPLSLAKVGWVLAEWLKTAK